MTVDSAALRNLHQVLLGLDELRSRRARGPMQVRAGEGKVERCQQDVHEQQALLTRTKLTIAEKELQLKERENRILDLRGKLNSCSTNKEYQALIERIAADEQANSVLSDEILELYDKLNAQQAALASARQEFEKSQTDLAVLRQRVEAARGSLEQEIAQTEERLRKAEECLPPEVMPHYRRMIKAHQADALAPIESQACGGCFQSITPQMVNELKMAQFVTCKSCGRILYLPEST